MQEFHKQEPLRKIYSRITTFTKICQEHIIVTKPVSDINAKNRFHSVANLEVDATKFCDRARFNFDLNFDGGKSRPLRLRNKETSDSLRVKNFYESRSQEVLLGDMRKSRGGKARLSPAKKRKLSPRKSTLQHRQSLKRQDSPSEPSFSLSSSSQSSRVTRGANDSVIILSPTKAQPTNKSKSSPRGGPGVNPTMANSQHLKRIRLLDSSSTSTRSSGNETIDLVDDDDEEDYLDLLNEEEATIKPNVPKIEDKEIILLSDEDSKSELSELPAPVMPVGIITGGNEDCEIIAVKVVGTHDSTSRRKSLSNSGKFPVGQRKSLNLSYKNVKSAVDKAKKCISSNLAKTSGASHAIRKNKNKQKKGSQGPKMLGHGNRRPYLEFQTPVSMQKSKPPQRRPTSPIFLLDRELGPANRANRATNFQSGRPSHFPSTSSVWRRGPTSSRGMRETTPNPFFGRMPVPLLPPQQPLIPVEPNFISVPKTSQELRTPVDGSNVAMSHKGKKTFSCRGIQICVEFFKRRGHEVVAFVPQYRRKHSESEDTDILDAMETEGTVKFTPSREVGGKRIAAYDDRFIVQYAHLKEAIIISNDNFKDIYEEQPEWRETLKFRILQFTWMDEHCIMFPTDPMGRGGPNLETFLRF
ncbi:hypothetical protein Fcan01_02010 [Folsomia candida]|uniref:RNase NYN domain-containing protein n=1 Tax=Folsomia candida TaxID=158441 RepID=A0A226EXV4_FOLCA|nr:hypothetical protein Fcan01_02010 [Folsomia candida]